MVLLGLIINNEGPIKKLLNLRIEFSDFIDKNVNSKDETFTIMFNDWFKNVLNFGSLSNLFNAFKARALQQYQTECLQVILFI